MNVMRSPRWHRHACVADLSVGTEASETLCLTSSSSTPLGSDGGKGAGHGMDMEAETPHLLSSNIFDSTFCPA
jgi:hypothetical protein